MVLLQRLLHRAVVGRAGGDVHFRLALADLSGVQEYDHAPDSAALAPSPPALLLLQILGGPQHVPTRLVLNSSPLSYRPLSADKLPGKGDLISIDCEFIALNCEEAEIMPDGHRIIRKEADLRLGRVTVLTHELDVFVDDYILCEDSVADYLTRFSGLTHEDLELKKSKHHLVELKDAYSRLRMLVDRGCVFVGHGRGSFVGV